MLYSLLILSATILGCAIIVIVLHYYLNNLKKSSWDCDKTTNTCKDPGTGNGNYKNKQDCIDACSSKWTKIQGLGGDGYCYGPQNSYPATKVVTTENCRSECEKDPNCVAYSSKLDNSVCVLYSTNKTTPTGYNDPSSNWKSSFPFPSFASGYYNCTIPPPKLTKTGCMYQNPSQSCDKSNGLQCWKKPNMIMETYSDDPKIADPDGLQAQVVVSNPYLPAYKLISTPNTFYWWYLDLIKTAKSFITICNAYITLGKWRTDDPTDYQSAIYYAYIDALNRGISVTWVDLSYDQTECQDQVISQFSKYHHFTRVPWDYYNNIGCSGQISCAFFHDKLYISDSKAYIGGQNTSGSSSIDFGISFPSTSPMYGDIKQRADWFINYGKITINFNYLSTKPYTTNNTDYFLVISPTWPLCPKNSSVFPQPPCPLGNSVGPLVTNTWKYGGDESNTAKGKVSYERNHLIDLIGKATKFLKITNFDFSIFSSQLSLGGWDKNLSDAFNNAAKNGVTIDMWINNTPFNDALTYGNATCNFLRCPEGQTFMDNLQQYDNVKFHWWYQSPPSTESRWSDCKTLHAKIYYSDWGVMISSANLTPDYFGHTSNTGLAARFNGKPVPKWISVGIENIFSILKDNSRLKSGQCDNYDPNFQKTPDPRCSNGYCENTCAQCGTFHKNSCGNACTK